MTLFLVLVFVAAGIAVLATLAMGLINLARAGSNPEGEAARMLKSQKLMQQRVILQGVAIAALAIILLIAMTSR